MLCQVVDHRRVGHFATLPPRFFAFCSCARCRSYHPADWYANLIRAMHEPLSARGKLLVVRDFAYSKNEQDAVVDACARARTPLGFGGGTASSRLSSRKVAPARTFT